MRGPLPNGLQPGTGLRTGDCRPLKPRVGGCSRKDGLMLSPKELVLSEHKLSQLEFELSFLILFSRPGDHYGSCTPHALHIFF